MAAYDINAQMLPCESEWYSLKTAPLNGTEFRVRGQTTAFRINGGCWQKLAPDHNWINCPIPNGEWQPVRYRGSPA